jgi:hypothetical protein
MSTACPYCQSIRGYVRIQQVKRLRIYAWDGTYLEDQDENIFYEGKALRCISCDEKVTSFVRGLAREK